MHSQILPFIFLNIISLYILQGNQENFGGASMVQHLPITFKFPYLILRKQKLSENNPFQSF